MLQSSEKKLMAINLIDEENKRRCNCNFQTASLLFHEIIRFIMKCVRAGELLKRSDTTDTSKESRLLCHADFLSHTDILFPLTSDFS